MLTLAIFFNPFQFALIHELNFPGSYAILLFIASDLASITSHICSLVLFFFGSIPSFFLELFLLMSSSVLGTYWPGEFLFCILSFCLFILFMGFSKQEYWSGLTFPSPVDHILSDFSVMTRPSWVAPQAWLGFTELDKVVVLVWLDWLIYCEYGFGLSVWWKQLTNF